MKAVQSLLNDGGQLKSKYGLKRWKLSQDISQRQPKTRIPSPFEKVFQTSSKFWNTALQRKSSIAGAIRWTVSDKVKFDNLIEDMRSLIADLTLLTADYGIAQSQKWVISYELETVTDEGSLEIITQVNPPGSEEEITSVIADQQLKRIRGRSTINVEGLLKPDDSISLFNKQVPSSTDELEEEVEFGQQPIEVTRVPSHQWRHVKTRQGIFPWLGVLLVSSNASNLAESSALGLNDGKVEESFSFLQRAGEVSLRNSERLSKVPSRVAVNSRILLAVLNKITDVEVSESRNVFIFPFKYLLVHEGKIRIALERLKFNCLNLRPREDSLNVSGKRFITSSQLGIIAADGAKESDSTAKPLIDLERIKDELSCLIHFMDTDLSELFAFRRSLFRNTCSEIRFEDLWFLYNPGDLVCSEGVRSESETAQAYFVLHVTGGRTILKSSPNEEDIFDITHNIGDVRDEGDFT